MTPLPAVRSILAASLFAALGGCVVTQDQEVAAGAQEAAQVNAQLPIIQDPAVEQYINDLGSRMASRTSRSDLNWQFYVVNASEANAFALPGGFVYVNRGLIDLTHTEAELAGALGHEIGHVIQRHAVRQMATQEKANLGVAAVCMLTNVCNSNVARAAIQVGGAAAFAHHSRHDEAQADSEAIVNTLRAGIDPRGVPSLFQRLLQTRQQQPTLVDGWFTDHPLEESRIRHTDAILERINPSRLAGLETDSPEYVAMRERLRSIPAPPPPRARGLQDSQYPDQSTQDGSNGGVP